MTAKDLITQKEQLTPECVALPQVEASLPVMDVLPKLLDSPSGTVAVMEDGQCLGVVDAPLLLNGIGHTIAERDDCSTVSLECAPAEYSASLLARAVEDADAHLVDLWTAPAPEGKILVTLRIGVSDPSPVVHSLERYNFTVTECHGISNADYAVAQERLLALQAFLNV